MPDLEVHLAPGCSPRLAAHLGRSSEVRLVEEPKAARLIVFDNDDPLLVRRSELWRRFPDACVAVSEWDRPAFALPGLYSSNDSCLAALRPTETMHYPLLESVNPWIARYAGRALDKAYLYSFMGRPSNFIRRRLFRRHHRVSGDRTADRVVEPTTATTFGPASYGDELQKRYVEVMARSCFALCPRGFGTGSVRLFEACQMGVAPVILSDRWPPVSGVDWSFAVFVREADFANLETVLEPIRGEAAVRGRAARKAYDAHFSPEATPRKLSDALSRIAGRMASVRETAAHRLARLAYPAGRWAVEQAIETRNSVIETAEVWRDGWDIPAA